MRSFPAPIAIGLTAVALALAGAPAGHASTTMESTFQDDNQLVYAAPAATTRTLDTLRGLGVDRLRISVFWNVVAPLSGSRTRPRFDASDPAAYPPGSWERYDRLARLAQARSMDVNFDITSPAPFWATGHPHRLDIEKNYNPSAIEFGRFVTAAGRRYSGSYTPPGASAPLPRVSYWSIWNEPNQAGWLTPQWSPDRHRRGQFYERSPMLYRALADAAFAALGATGHGDDTILLGETAPKGLGVRGITRSIKALHFLRLLYCLSDRFVPLGGRTAVLQGCPSTNSARAGFVAAHPALFRATGYSHHPYELTFAPDRVPGDHDFATIANLPVLEQTLVRIMRIYHVARGGIPLYLTEFGYQTNPPSPIGVTLKQQAAYLDQAQFIAYNNPFVQTLSQFLLVDDAPRPAADAVGRFGASFQTGLEFAGGAHKPSYESYRLAVYVPITHTIRGHPVRVWGQARAARSTRQYSVSVQFRAAASRGYRTIATLTSDATHGFVDSRVRIPASGLLRLAWSPGGGGAVYSRLIRITAG